jgi:hypothetical protein
MNQFYLYDKQELGAYNRARREAVGGLSSRDWGREYIFVFFD